MHSERVQNPIQRRLLIFARAASALSIAIPFLVLLGWQFDIGWLKSLLPHLVTMKPLTAISFLCCGVSLGLHASRFKPARHAAIAARALPLVAAACGITTLAGSLTGRDFQFEGFLFHRALLASGIEHPGRMSSASAVAFIVLALALVLFDFRPGTRTRLWQPLCLAVALFAMIQILGYLYGVGDLYKTFGQNPMAVHTAVLFFLLSLGLFASRSDLGWMAVLTSPLAGGLIARRILPTAILLPVLVGWIRLEGQHRGFYQTEFGLALFASLNIATFAIVVWFGARSLNASAITLHAANTNLAISEERLRMATEGGSIGTWNWNLLTGEMHNSPLCRQICGLPPTGDVRIEETLARVHPEDRSLVDAQISTALRAGGHFEVECRMVWPGGSVHWVVSKGRVFADPGGPPARMEGIVQEITQRKFAEGQIKRLAAIVEFSDDAIVSRDLQGAITTWNPGAEKLYGYTAPEVLGKPPLMLRPPGQNGGFEEAFQKACLGEITHQLETQRRAKSGKVLDISLTVTPLRDSQSAIVGVSSIARDITEHRAVERQLRQAQKMEAVGQLAGGVAHDFNNLVMVINSYAQLIMEHPASDGVSREYADQILRAGEKAAAVTRQLLAFSRKQQQVLKVVDLNELVTHFCQFLPRILGEELKLQVHPHVTAVCVKADQGQLEQVLMNLVVNARDAMPHGGILSIALERSEVDADDCFDHGHTIPAGSYAVLSVKDSGVGMDSETKSHIFEPFFTTKEVGKGTGLGLATVYGIVKQHKGMVSVYSEPGLGTEFRIYLPLCGKDLQQEQKPVLAIPTQEGSETILVVEDEESLREVIVNYLITKGYNVLAAEHGAAAVRLCDSWTGHIDLLLTDFIMPGMRGPEVAAEIRKKHPQTRVIFMSGYADRELQVENAEQKHYFLQKPLSLRILVEQIRTALAEVTERV